jgi:hypothetical protein
MRRAAQQALFERVRRLLLALRAGRRHGHRYHRLASLRSLAFGHWLSLFGMASNAEISSRAVTLDSSALTARISALEAIPKK